MNENKKQAKMQDEFTTKMHEELLDNKEADQYSNYITYKKNVEIFGEEYAMEIMGFSKPPRSPEDC